MANQEELQRITDSTLRELAAIVEHHIRNYQDQEKAALREELDKLKKEKDMKNEIRKSIEDSNQVLTRQISETVLHSKIQEETKDRQLGRVEKSTAERVMEKEQAKMFFYHAMESCARKEERYIRTIRKMNDYIHGLHSTLERNGIFNGTGTKQSDETEESDEYESYESDDSNNHFENHDDGNYDELEKQSDDEDEESQETSNTVAENSVLESDETVQHQVDHYSIVAANPQELSWCDMIDAEELELNQQSQLDEPENSDLPENEPSCKDEDKKSQEASNTVAENAVLESDEPIKSDVPQKIKLDPFVHCYREVKLEEVKKPKKKQQKRKPKSKPKFTSLTTFGRF